MAITFIGSNSRPADNSGATGPTSGSLMFGTIGVAVGDLAIVIAQYNGAATITMAESGGQNWQLLSQYTSASGQTFRVIWCEWQTDNGNNPTCTVTSGSAEFTCYYAVWRPTSAANTWTVDVAQNTAQFSAPGSPFGVTITGVTTTRASTVTVAAWHSDDNNVWGTMTGSGWTDEALVRNLNMASAFAYNIKTSAGATGNVAKEQDTLGGDAGATMIVSFSETNEAVGFDTVVAWLTA